MSSSPAPSDGPKRLLVALLLACSLPALGLVLTTLSPESTPVVWPVLAATFFWLAFYAYLRSEPRSSSAVFEIGFIYASAVWLYACYPLVGFAVNGFAYGPLNDLRLHLADPRPADVGRIGWMYVVHLVAFVAAYSFCRGTGVAARPASVGRIEALFLLVLVAIAQGYFAILGWTYGWNFTANVDRYVAYASLPQLAAQVTGHMDGIRLTAEIGLLVFLFQRYATYRPWIFAWLGVTAVITLVQRQSRTELVLLCFTSAILYDTFVRRVRIYSLVGLAVAGLVAFNLLGVRRMAAGEVHELSGFRRLFVANEFESIFANAFDLDARLRSETLEPPPPGMRAVDLAALVPQQFVAFQKVTPADWYIKTMYPAAAEAGVGFCFGSVSESIVSGGWPDLLWRGALLGVAVGVVHRVVTRRSALSVWWFIFGTWLSVLIYHSFRNTTFTFVAMAWYRFLPVVLAVSVASGLVRAARDRPSPARKD